MFAMEKIRGRMDAFHPKRLTPELSGQIVSVLEDKLVGDLASMVFTK
jgi:hypothetical protein